MCGLFASVVFAPDRRFIDAVHHRGPDGDGWQTFESPAGSVALGHRRLSIIDLDARASQPMSCGDGRFWLVFNGEIYNYLEIRAELQSLGRVFRTQSDGEVLLEAYKVWGEDALQRFIGMFAFLIWDARDKVLFAARDRLGIKPLFYLATPHGIAFGSEIKQLTGLPGYRAQLNPRRAHDFLTHGITDHTTETLFDGIASLAPGHCLKLDLTRWRASGALAPRAYWSVPEPESAKMSLGDAATQFRALFMDSIKLHMRSDVRVGSCLSGGLDSSSIVGAQSLYWPEKAEPLHAISAVFPGTAVDESRFIDDVIAKTKAKSLRVTCSPEQLIAETDDILRAQDEPFGSTSLYAQYRVFETARAHGVKVMLDGQGADELLGGYHGCFHFHYARLIRSAQLFGLLRTLSERKRWHGISMRDQLAPYLARLPGPLGRAFQAPAPAGSAPLLCNAFESAHAPRHGGLMADLLAAEGRGPIRSLGDYCVLLTQSTSLPMLLRYEDRNSMAHGIEARVPFLDHRLVEFAIRLGDQHKIVGGDTKHILRRALADLLPPSVAHRRDKIGFATPEATWFRGPLREQIRCGIEDTLSLAPSIFDAACVRAHVEATLDGQKSFDFSLWRLYIFGRWMRMHGLAA